MAQNRTQTLLPPPIPKRASMMKNVAVLSDAIAYSAQGAVDYAAVAFQVD